jgi:hypothetical protein
VTEHKSSLILKIILQNTQALQLFRMMIKPESIYKKFLKMPSWKTWVKRPSGLTKSKRGKAQALKVK